MVRRRKKHPLRPHRVLLVFLGLLATLLTTGSGEPSALARVKQNGALTVITRHGPTTTYEGANGLSGFEYTLTKGFADYLGVDLHIKQENNIATLLDKVGGSESDLAAAGLTITDKRRNKLRFGPAYQQVQEFIIYRRNAPKPATINDLIGGKLMVLNKSSHAERLRQIRQDYPELRWKEKANIEILDLLDMVESGEIDYTIIDSNAYRVNRHLYPQLKVALVLDGSRDIAWAFPKNGDNSLYAEAEKYFKEIEENGKLAQIKNHFFGYSDKLKLAGAKLFNYRIENRLPRYKNHLQNAADTEGLDWHLLAAISYQESHWNPNAVSPTGVTGFMMLTRNTAKEVGVSNRRDVVESIMGGAKYFSQIYRRIPEQIKDPDRTNFALAAYNVGLGHLEDARVLTERMGGNANRWSEVKQHLPLLAKPKYYKTLKHGYARGWEPVNYVESVHQYREILSWNSVLEQRRLSALEDDASAFPPALTRESAAGSLSVL